MQPQLQQQRVEVEEHLLAVEEMPHRALLQGNHTFFYYANTTSLSKKVKQWLQAIAEQDFFQIICLAEVHKLGTKAIAQLRRQLEDIGWQMAIEPAIAKNAGTTGGIAILAKSHLAMSTRVPQLSDPAGVLDGRLKAALFRFQGFSLIIITIYLETGVGLAGNFDRLQILAAYLQGLRCQWLVIGDFNFPPLKMLIKFPF